MVSLRFVTESGSYWFYNTQASGSEHRHLRPLPQRHRRMKKLLTILFAVALGLNLSAQTDYVETWDPDADGDGLIGVSDLLALAWSVSGGGYGQRRHLGLSGRLYWGL